MNKLPEFTIEVTIPNVWFRLGKTPIGFGTKIQKVRVGFFHEDSTSYSVFVVDENGGRYLDRVVDIIEGSEKACLYALYDLWFHIRQFGMVDALTVERIWRVITAIEGYEVPQITFSIQDMAAKRRNKPTPFLDFSFVLDNRNYRIQLSQQRDSMNGSRSSYTVTITNDGKTILSETRGGEVRELSYGVCLQRVYSEVDLASLEALKQYMRALLVQNEIAIPAGSIVL